ncbi:protoporphyrinogen oxidase [Desulfocapsa sulfexigens DSM 10523]|uniref:Protoporphyrinogen oxidase n=1 Tax=Desulfocapsa sulfexigens (strain DSM 10523 / SB164P1) TaxID=1167006 RepID=M1P4X5_DESSD|nr:FAD-dependent oxidoreductase [Desulfocapsa sulfexigens]AGF78513.1 protoporphyrinogen oxidase [Desulfocapsa sulfexigens DSM 10523]
MSSEKQTIIILGAGPAGLMLAFKLLQRAELNIELIIIEKRNHPGGIAASFQQEGIWLDYGSHRLHPSTPEHILNDIKNIIGPSLLKRVRNGRIRLQGHYLKFPLQPLDCLVHLPVSFIFGIFRDILKKPFRPSGPALSFADQLLHGLGPTICEKFYFPYAKKLWGCPPDQIDVEQARKRVSAGTVSKIVKKMLSFLPGVNSSEANVFYYPEEGIGQISEKLAAKVTDMDGQIIYDTTVTGITMEKSRGFSISVKKHNDVHKQLKADFIFSTIPVTRIVSLLASKRSCPALTAAESLTHRNMVFFYLLMECDQWQVVDAHYFPETDYIFSRISEGKNYNGTLTPRGKTIICCEIPCQHDDEIWLADDEKLKRLVLADMKKGAIPAKNLVKVFSKRQTNVYPVYTIGYSKKLRVIEQYLSKIPTLISLGRQGLFTHDNIHHTMMMADRAAHCLGINGQWDVDKWEEFCNEFSNYVVVD